MQTEVNIFVFLPLKHEHSDLLDCCVSQFVAINLHFNICECKL